MNVPQKLLILSSDLKTKKHIGFSKTPIHLTYQRAGRRYFNKTSLMYPMSFLINKCFFTIGNLIFKQHGY